jgi:hypothetical protein
MVKRESEITRSKRTGGRNAVGNQHYRGRGEQYRGRGEQYRGRGEQPRGRGGTHYTRGEGRGYREHETYRSERGYRRGEYRGGYRGYKDHESYRPERGYRRGGERGGRGDYRGHESNRYGRGEYRGGNHTRGREHYTSHRPPYYQEEEQKLNKTVPFSYSSPKLKIPTKIIEKHLYPYFRGIMSQKNCSHELKQNEKDEYIVETTINSESAIEIQEIMNLLQKIQYTTRTVVVRQTDLNAVLIMQKIQKYCTKYEVSIKSAKVTQDNPTRSYKIEGLIQANVELVLQKLQKFKDPLFQISTNYY